MQATSVLRRVRESERIRAAIEDAVERHRLQERCTAALFDAALGLRIRNSAYPASLRGWEEISHGVATADLAAMVRAGLLEKRGQKRGTFYVAAGETAEIRKRYQAGRQAIDTTKLFEPPTHPSANAQELPFGRSLTAASEQPC